MSGAGRNPDNRFGVNDTEVYTVFGLLRIILVWLLNVAQLVLLAYCILSWFTDRNNPALRFLARISDPILQPIQNAMRRSTRSEAWIGFAPLVAVLLIQVIAGLLRRL